MEINYNSVYYSYNENTPLEHIALEDVTLNIKSEKINGIIGNNGSGKTSLLKLLDALLLPTIGTIKIGHYKLEPKKTIKKSSKFHFMIGFVCQSPKEQFFSKTVKEEIAFAMQQFSYKTDQMDLHIANALKMVGLEESYLDRNPLELSSGEMKKVSIASILVFNPKILIFDEPLAGLDGISKESFIKMLKILKNRYHKTVIVSTNNSNDIHKIADYLFVFKNGNKVAEGTKYEIFEQENIEELGIIRPLMIEFSYQVLKQKGIRLGYRDDINDLIKDIYRHVS